ncbi:MAG: hypothetical protein QOG85_490 [Gaiellaceae bacterium]|jgi:hypothetical protein|nr:hypothetical protein [Gaiellaceae bacterium]
MNPVLWVVVITLVSLNVAGLWFVFLKAGEPGWQAVVPLWNVWVLRRICGGGRGSLLFESFLAQDLARSFGKGFWFAAGLWLLPFIFVPILGFGSATYQGAANAEPWGESLSGF